MRKGFHAYNTYLNVCSYNLFKKLHFNDNNVYFNWQPKSSNILHYLKNIYMGNLKKKISHFIHH